MAVVVAVGTLRRNRWGINTKRVKCPRCGTPAPLVRTPGSVSQGMWGGFTCPSCGCEVDKWGRDISGPGTPRG